MIDMTTSEGFCILTMEEVNEECKKNCEDCEIYKEYKEYRENNK